MKQKRQVNYTSTTRARRSAHRKVTHHAKQLLVPHRHNKYQPHLVRKTGLIAVIALVFAVQVFYNLSTGGIVLGGESNVTTERLLDLTNKERARYHQSALQFDDKLADAATFKAEDMFKENYWAHTSPGGATPWQWFGKADYSYSYAGENLAKDFKTAESVMSAWMNSPEHRKNILSNNYTDIGFSVTNGELNGKATTLVVAMYGAPKSGVTLATQPAVLAATDNNQSLMTQFGRHLQSMTPVALSSILLLLTTAIVAGVAHLYRKQLPKPLRVSWRKHHGLYKAAGMTCLAVIFIALYSGGQI